MPTTSRWRGRLVSRGDSVGVSLGGDEYRARLFRLDVREVVDGAEECANLVPPRFAFDLMIDE